MTTDYEANPGTPAESIPDPATPDAAPGDEPAPRPTSHLVFPVAGHALLLDGQYAMEFLEGQRPYHIPSNHPYFLGLINRRGSLVPVFDIRKLFDGEVRDRGENRILVLGTGDHAVGIVLDATPYRVSVAEERQASPPVKLVQVFGEFLGDCFEHGGESLTRVALEDFLYGLAHEVK